jgi:hypothetical protein
VSAETAQATGEQRELRGIESYAFRDSKLATKDLSQTGHRLICNHLRCAVHV